MGKGSQFERDISRQLSLWWSKGEHDDWFWRATTSGARATVRKKAGKDTANNVGDIAAQCPEAMRLMNAVSFELKKGYNQTGPQDLILKDKSKIHEFIDQATRQASNAGTPYWALIHKADRKPTLVYTNFELLTDLHLAEFRREERVFWVSRIEDTFNSLTREWVNEWLRARNF